MLWQAFPSLALSHRFEELLKVVRFGGLLSLLPVGKGQVGGKQRLVVLLLLLHLKLSFERLLGIGGGSCIGPG